MILIATAGAATPSTTEAAQDCIAQLSGKGIEAPHYLMVQCDQRHDLAKVRDAFKSRWPQVRLHAASSCLGSMIETASLVGPAPGLCVLALCDPAGDYGTACAELGADPRATGRTLIRQALLHAQRAGEVPAMVWVSSVPGTEEQVIAGLHDVVGPSVPIVGGSAADNTIAGQWKVMSDGDPIDNGAVISVWFPSARVGAAFHSGYTATAQSGRITRCKGRRIFELDGRPAADVYAEWTQGAVRKPDSGSVNVLAASALWPLGRRIDDIGGTDVFVLSHPETLNADGSLTLFTNVQEQEVLVLMRGTLDSLLERPALVSESACRMGEIEPGEVAGMILVFCAGCMLTVRDRLDEVRHSLTERLPGVPFITAFTFGEQGPVISGENRHGNLMISAVVFARD